MFLIGATQKAQKELKREIKPNEDFFEDPINQWHVNLFKRGRFKCLLFTNDATLYSVVIPKVRKEHFEKIEGVFLKELRESLISNGFNTGQVDRFLSQGDDMIFTKSRSRSVLGCMNDMVFMIECFPHEKDFTEMDSKEWTQSINHTPYSSLSGVFPIEELMKRLS